MPSPPFHAIVENSVENLWKAVLLALE